MSSSEQMANVRYLVDDVIELFEPAASSPARP
jgi:hypothetical protein